MSNTTALAPVNRIDSLDWLRGLMAVSIMVYHYINWIVGHQDAGTTLGRLGIYGVCTFYVLSGLSLSIVYDRFIKKPRGIIKFYIRRIFRILPLMWVAVALVIAFNIIKHYDQPSAWVIFLNLTTLFGFISPGDYLPTGAWSIGNEMVFYLFTPFLLLLYNRSRLWGNIVTLLSWITGGIFAFILLKPGSAIAGQWLMYINPFNHFFLFCSGIFLYYNFRSLTIRSAWLITSVVVLCLLFVLLPAAGDTIGIVTGFYRLIYSLISIAMVLLFWKINFRLPGFIEKPLASFGIATYSVYILHPFTIIAVNFAFGWMGVDFKWLTVLLSFIGTVVVSLLIYRFYEKPFMDLGKRVTS